MSGRRNTRVTSARDWVSAALVPTAADDWVLTHDGYVPLSEHVVESRFAIGNGFLGMRAARAASRGPLWLTWQSAQAASWPRSFVAGLFDILDADPPVPALAPAPDWLRFQIHVDGRPWFLKASDLVVHRRTLDLRRGLVISEWRQRDGPAVVVSVRTLRLVSQSERALGLQLIQLEAQGSSSCLGLDAAVELPGTVLDLVRVGPGLAVWRSVRCGRGLAIATSLRLRVSGRRLARQRTTPGPLRGCWTWTAGPHATATFARLVAVARAPVGEDPAPAARTALRRAQRSGPRKVLADHERAWAARWAASDVQIDGDGDAQRSLRFAIYHLISAANPDDEHVSISARALTGDAYLGHVFWDTDTFLLPFYTLTWPAAARALLMYRYHTLPAARAKAARLGYRGALYAWESADNGDETTPDYVVGMDGQATPILCGTQEQHISADVAYAVWQYWLAQRDVPFLLQSGAEIVLETARFWASRVERDSSGTYHIRCVIGPDEYHESVDDNAFTNYMARWNLECGLEVAQLLSLEWPERWIELAARLGLSEDELEDWRVVTRLLHTGRVAENGVIEQFGGYFGLEPIDLTAYESRTVPMEFILGRERTARSQVIKQSDVVMLLAMLWDRFSPAQRRANMEYYAPRCGHGSSLSRATHALVAARLGDLDRAKRQFDQAAAIDLQDTTRTGSGGVHIAALGGLWQTAVLGFGGLSLEPDGLRLEPHLPAAWRRLRFGVHWRGSQLRLDLDAEARTVAATLESGKPLVLRVGETATCLQAGDVQTMRWPG